MYELPWQMLMDLGFVMDEPKIINSTKLLDYQR